MDSWLGRSTLFVVPLANLGNVATTFQIVGADRLGRCRFDFRVPNLTGSDLEGQGWVHLEAGDTAQIPVIVTPLQRPLIGIGGQRVPIRFLVHAIGSHERPRTVDTATDVAPVIGIWHMLGVLALIALLVVGVVLAGLAALWTVRQSAPTAAQPSPAAIEQPAVTILINTVPPGSPASHNTAAQAAANTLGAVPVSERAGPAVEPRADLPLAVGGVPVVHAQQVTAPGEPVSGGIQAFGQPIASASDPSANVQPIVVQPGGGQERGAAARSVDPASPRPAGMTYAQMFREIALRYDLDWRMLAAQAYIESGFDSLALGSHGDLGLMQIRPATWREWAPTVDAADPFDSYSNVLVGAAYLDFLRSFFGQRGYSQVEWMLVAYYWGPDHVLGYLQDGGTWEALDPDLRNYALDILRIAQTLPNN
jgi:soluble lytic murein transglycosylase-like protein